ncbi:hypothetical protein THIOSC15_670005 [uncultured Thiomicrorhabdus sp.]
MDDIEDFDFNGNYVRVNTDLHEENDLKDLRKIIMDEGARGIVLMPSRKVSVVARTEGTIEHKNLHHSVAEFINK